MESVFEKLGLQIDVDWSSTTVWAQKDVLQGQRFLEVPVLTGPQLMHSYLKITIVFKM